MDSQEIIKKVENFIANGQTEEAIETLVEFTKSVDSEQHDNAVLLSGQYKQWKRQSMLGVQESSHELRRIEMGILNILKGDDPAPSSNLGADSSGARKTSMHKIIPIVGGVLGIIAVIVVIWMLMGQQNNESAISDTQATEPATTPAEPAATSVENNENFSILAIAPGTDLEKDKRYYTEDKLHYLIFQDDGNLAIYSGSGDVYVGGSYHTAGGNLASKVRFLEDGNFVIDGDDGRPFWSTNTIDLDAKLGITESGALVVVDGKDEVIWKGVLKKPSF